MSGIIRGKVIRDVEFVQMHSSYGEWPFKKVDGKWIDKVTGKPCRVMKLSDFLNRQDYRKSITPGALNNEIPQKTSSDRSFSAWF